MKTNIFLFILVIFIISLIITLNMFFQESYQSEMAEQFNRQQLLIAKSVAKSIEGDLQHIEGETLSLVRLLGEGGLSGKTMEESVYTAYVDLSEDLNVTIKILDGNGRAMFSSHGEPANASDIEYFEGSASLPPGKVTYIDRLAQDRKLVLLTPIVKGSSRKGLLIMELSIDTISKKFLAPIKAGIRGHAWMMSGNGTLLYHPTQPKMVGKNLYKADRSCFAVSPSSSPD